jgi:hypothetical protein
MKPRRHIYMYRSARAGVTELFAAHHRVRHRLNPHPSLGGIQVGGPGGFDLGRADA